MAYMTLKICTHFKGMKTILVTQENGPINVCQTDTLIAIKSKRVCVY